jgi:beta-lactamase regulating signal transducer with metallopeptidase domain
MAGVNRALFWFHPLAWWTERRLAALAEQACDDAALAELGSRENYARALLACLSQFAVSGAAKPFGISGGYPEVFTTGKVAPRPVSGRAE